MRCIDIEVNFEIQITNKIKIRKYRQFCETESKSYKYVCQTIKVKIKIRH